MKIDKYVRITKIDENKTNINGVGVNYWIEGVLTRDVKIGFGIKAWRMRNAENPNGKLGIFTTSAVKSINNNIVETANSTYKVEETAMPFTEVSK